MATRNEDVNVHDAVGRTGSIGAGAGSRPGTGGNINVPFIQTEDLEGDGGNGNGNGNGNRNGNEDMMGGLIRSESVGVGVIGTNGGGSGSGSGRGGGGAGRTGRQPILPMPKPQRSRLRACAPCRKRKMLCDRQDPCGSCVSRGQADECDWEGSTPLAISEFNPLRIELDRLNRDLEALATFTSTLQSQTQSRQESTPGGNSSFRAEPSSSGLSIPVSIGNVYSGVSSSGPATTSGYRIPTSNDPNVFPSIPQAASTGEVLLQSKSDLVGGLTDLILTKRPGGESGEPNVQNEVTSFSTFAPDLRGTRRHARRMTDSDETVAQQEFIDDAVKLLERADVSSAGPSSATLVFPPAVLAPERSISELGEILPNRAVSDAAVASFFGQSGAPGANEWMGGIVQAHIFKRRYATYWTSYLHDSAVGADWVASYLALLGFGMVVMTDAHAGDEIDVPQTEAERKALGKSWFKGAIDALTIANFMSNPTLEVVRTLILLAYYWFWFSGEQAGRVTSSLLTTATTLACQIDLNYDPDDLDPFPEGDDVQDRRRVWYALATLEGLVGSVFSRRPTPIFTIFNDVRLPTDYERSSHPSTPSTGHAFNVRVAATMIQIRQFFKSSRRSSYSEIQTLDAQLTAAVDALPQGFLLLWNGRELDLAVVGRENLSARLLSTVWLNQAYLTLHRPFLGITTSAPYDIAFHCRRVSDSARCTLSLYRSELLRRSPYFPIHTVVSAAMALGILLLRDPHSSEARDIRHEIHNVMTTFATEPKQNSIMLRAERMLGWLLDKSSPGNGRHATTKYLPVNTTTQPFNSIGSFLNAT